MAKELPCVDGGGDLPEHLAVRARSRHEQDLAGHGGARERQRGHVGGGDHPAAGSGPAPLREREAEVQEHDGQEQDGQRVRPEQRPVRQVELARVRRRVHQEEEQADRVEVQRGPVRRAPQHDDGAHEQAEEADQREVVEEADVALRERLDDHFQRPPLVGAEQLVDQMRSGLTPREVVFDLLRADHLFAIQTEDDVARADSRQRRRATGGHARGVDAFGPLRPEHAVVHQRPGRLQEDVVRAQRGQDQGHGDDGDVLEARAPHHGQPWSMGVVPHGLANDMPVPRRDKPSVFRMLNTERAPLDPCLRIGDPE